MKTVIAEMRRTTVQLLSGYGQVFFTTRWYSSALFMAATFVVPSQGLAGLGGMLLANINALVLGLPRRHIHEGYYACNGLLVGLALGLTYRVNLHFLLALLLSSFLVVLLAATVRTVCERYTGTPPLSVPFVLTTWIAVNAGGQFSGLIYALEPFQVTTLMGLFPNKPEFVFRSLGATFFQLSVPAGILVAVGLFLSSRYGFVLGLLGLAAGSLVHSFLGGKPDELEGGCIGFNYALTAIALGGIWAFPRPASLLLAGAGAAASSIVTAAALMILKPLGLPVLAFPFVATTSLILFAVKQRERERGIQLIHEPAGSPEDNLKRSRNLERRALTLTRPGFDLPFQGEWTVTQGVMGPHTHSGSWAHAWDFEVCRSNGKAFRENGAELVDYLTYQLPVLAPADGKVVHVVDHVHDNPIGQVNAQSNWGNLVVIWHYGGFYSALCHLAAGEVTVQEGDHVRAGQVVAKAGSSGRSPRPHLHMQIQQGPEIGAPTVKSDFLHYVVKDNGCCQYVTRGVPKEGETVKCLVHDPTRFQAACFPLGRSWTFVVRDHQHETEEIWDSEVDFWSFRYLVCRQTGARIRFYVDKKALILVDYSGPARTGLWWFFIALPRLPLTRMNVTWRDKPPPHLLLSRTRECVYELLEPFALLADIHTDSRFVASDPGTFVVETIINLTGPLYRSRADIRLVTTFDDTLGLLSITGSENGQGVVDIQNSCLHADNRDVQYVRYQASAESHDLNRRIVNQKERDHRPEPVSAERSFVRTIPIGNQLYARKE